MFAKIIATITVFVVPLGAVTYSAINLNPILTHPEAPALSVFILIFLAALGMAVSVCGGIYKIWEEEIHEDEDTPGPNNQRGDMR